MVLTMGQPPNAVPRVRAVLHESFTHSGAESDADLAFGEEHGRDQPDRLLGVVRAVAERQRTRRHPLARPQRPADLPSGARERCGAATTRRSALRRSRTRGAIARASSTPSTPTGVKPSRPPQFTAPVPPSRSAAPTSPPMSACPELDGIPSRQVPVFQITEAVSPAPITATVCDGGSVTMPASVSATAVPSSSGPTTLPTVASATAGPGRAARVATSAAIEFAASCRPFVSANASAARMARTRPVIPTTLSADRTSRPAHPPIWLIERAGRMKSTLPMW